MTDVLLAFYILLAKCLLNRFYVLGIFIKKPTIFPDRAIERDQWHKMSQINQKVSYEV